MAQLREHILIQCDPTDVFDFINDIDQEPRWQPGIKEAEQDPPGPQKVGTRKRYVTTFMGKKFRNEYVNTRFERPYAVDYESVPGSDLQARGSVTVEPVAGGTLVTMVLDVETPRALKVVPKKMVDQRSHKELVQSLERLKALLESGA